MTSAEQSFKESLRAFNSGRSNTGTGGPLASIFPSSSSRAYQDGVDMESQESLLGSFQERASSMFSGLTSNSRNSECCGLTTFQRYTAFTMLIGTSILLFFISLFSIPMILLSPSKFALTYTAGNMLFMLSFSVLNGWLAHVKHLFSASRIPFTAAYLGSMFLTIFFAVIRPSYILVIFFCIIQIICLVSYAVSYLPGGTNGLRMLSRNTIGI